MNMMLDMQIRHQPGTPGVPVGFPRGIKRHDPHYGAHEERDDINLDTHDFELYGECGRSVVYGQYKSEAASPARLRLGSPSDEPQINYRSHVSPQVKPRSSHRMGCGKFELTAFDGEATLAIYSLAGGKTMDEPNRWRHMASAPKDGSRFLVTIRSTEQGSAEVDLAYWTNGDQFGAPGWRASDSSPGRIIEYAEPELKCWMPMPSANLNRTSMPLPWEGEDAQELDGSGI